MVKRRHPGRPARRRPGRIRARRLRLNAARARRRLARAAGSLGLRRPLVRRLAFALALLALVVVPLPVLAADTPSGQPGCTGAACFTAPVQAQLWVAPLPGAWTAGGAGDAHAPSPPQGRPTLRSAAGTWCSGLALS